MANLREISEDSAVESLESSTVVSTEVFPSEDLGATIMRFSNGVVWVKFKRKDGLFVNKWYVPRQVEAWAVTLENPTTGEITSVPEYTDEDADRDWDAEYEEEIPPSEEDQSWIDQNPPPPEPVVEEKSKKTKKITAQNGVVDIKTLDTEDPRVQKLIGSLSLQELMSGGVAIEKVSAAGLKAADPKVERRKARRGTR